MVVQLLQEVLECPFVFWYCPDPQPGHVRSAVVEQATNLVPIPQVVVHGLQTRFTVLEQAVDSYCDPEQAEAHSEHVCVSEVPLPVQAPLL